MRRLQGQLLQRVLQALSPVGDAAGAARTHPAYAQLQTQSKTPTRSAKHPRMDALTRSRSLSRSGCSNPSLRFLFRALKWGLLLSLLFSLTCSSGSDVSRARSGETPVLLQVLPAAALSALQTEAHPLRTQGPAGGPRVPSPEGASHTHKKASSNVLREERLIKYDQHSAVICYSLL